MMLKSICVMNTLPKTTEKKNYLVENQSQLFIATLPNQNAHKLYKQIGMIYGIHTTRDIVVKLYLCSDKNAEYICKFYKQHLIYIPANKRSLCKNRSVLNWIQ